MLVFPREAYEYDERMYAYACLHGYACVYRSTEDGQGEHLIFTYSFSNIASFSLGGLASLKPAGFQVSGSCKFKRGQTRVGDPRQVKLELL